jgi:hypothetical protein
MFGKEREGKYCETIEQWTITSQSEAPKWKEIRFAKGPPNLFQPLVFIDKQEDRQRILFLGGKTYTDMPNNP